MFEFGLEGQGHWETETTVDPPQSTLECFSEGALVAEKRDRKIIEW